MRMKFPLSIETKVVLIAIVAPEVYCFGLLLLWRLL